MARRKTILDTTIGETRFILASPAPAVQPILLDVAEAMARARSSSSRVYGLYALLGLTLRQPSVDLGLPEADDEGEVGRPQVLAYGRQVIERLEPMWGPWGLDEDGIGTLISSLTEALAKKGPGDASDSSQGEE